MSINLVHCQWPVLLPFDVDDPRLLPGGDIFDGDCDCDGVDCVLAVDIWQVELSVPGPHPARRRIAKRSFAILQTKIMNVG